MPPATELPVYKGYHFKVSGVPGKDMICTTTHRGLYYATKWAKAQVRRYKGEVTFTHATTPTHASPVAAFQHGDTLVSVYIGTVPGCGQWVVCPHRGRVWTCNATTPQAAYRQWLKAHS